MASTFGADNKVQDSIYGTVSCSSNNCDIQKFKTIYYRRKGSNSNTDLYDGLGIYKIKVKNANDTINYVSSSPGSDSNSPQMVSIASLRLNR